MANIASSRKRARQAVKRRALNISQLSRLRTHIKGVIRAIRTGDHATARTAFLRAVPVMDGSVNKGLIHKNKAARHKSRLNARVKGLAAAPEQ